MDPVSFHRKRRPRYFKAYSVPFGPSFSHDSFPIQATFSRTLRRKDTALVEMPRNDLRWMIILQISSLVCEIQYLTANT